MRTPGDERAELEAEHRQLTDRCQTLMQEWETLEEQREALGPGEPG